MARMCQVCGSEDASVRWRDWPRGLVRLSCSDCQEAEEEADREERGSQLWYFRPQLSGLESTYQLPDDRA